MVFRLFPCFGICPGLVFGPLPLLMRLYTLAYPTEFYGPDPGAEIAFLPLTFDPNGVVGSGLFSRTWFGQIFPLLLGFFSFLQGGLLALSRAWILI